MHSIALAQMVGWVISVRGTSTSVDLAFEPTGMATTVTLTKIMEDVMSWHSVSWKARHLRVAGKQGLYLSWHGKYTNICVALFLNMFFLSKHYCLSCLLLLIIYHYLLSLFVVMYHYLLIFINSYLYTAMKYTFFNIIYSIFQINNLLLLELGEKKGVRFLKYKY